LTRQLANGPAGDAGVDDLFRGVDVDIGFVVVVETCQA
jgi:hypothetical protein